MSYRKILVPLIGTERDSRVLDHAFEVAGAFGSHVVGLYVRPDPAEILPYLGEGVSAGAVQEIMDASRDAAVKASNVARAALESAAKVAGAPVESQPLSGIGASFALREGAMDDVVADEARLSDLVVFDCPLDANDVGVEGALESALINGRKPVLLVPHAKGNIVGTKAVIGWDGGATAANAISTAIPFLKRASAIEILNVTSGPIDTVIMDRLREYLRLHGLQAIEHGINPGSQGTSAALLDAAERTDAGLLVVGGYGHSRLRELVLGGTTRYIFNNARLPVLMAH